MTESFNCFDCKQTESFLLYEFHLSVMLPTNWSLPVVVDLCEPSSYLIISAIGSLTGVLKYNNKYNLRNEICRICGQASLN